MVETGNPNSITDAGVGALCARVAVYGAYLNVKINTAGLDDTVYAEKVIADSEDMLQRATQMEAEILAFIEARL
jgi:glutamate formiminotransferase/formiminotetrahydrofolate cyclodeaminase